MLSKLPVSLRFLCIILVAPVLLAACASEDREPEPRRPQQAGQPLNPVTTAAHIAGAQAAAVVGDQERVQANVHALSESYRKSIRLADPARAVDREAARTAAKVVDGVRSVVWIDNTNLFAIVARNEERSYSTIDAVCMQLEPLGDTLGVVVNLQSGAATNGDELAILSRNCQLKPGERALLQPNRKIDVVDPSVRAQHKANNHRPPDGYRCNGSTLQVNESGDSGSWKNVLPGQAAFHCPPGSKTPDQCFRVDKLRYCG